MKGLNKGSMVEWKRLKGLETQTEQERASTENKVLKEEEKTDFLKKKDKKNQNTLKKNSQKG